MSLEKEAELFSGSAWQVELGPAWPVTPSSGVCGGAGSDRKTSFHICRAHLLPGGAGQAVEGMAGGGAHFLTSQPPAPALV